MSDPLRKAAEMALKFCDDIGELGGPYPYVNGTGVVFDSRQVSKALRQALAQPEQEPVAWINFNNAPLYTAPPSVETAVLAEREACIEWLRNNYQDYKSISEICDAIRARSKHDRPTQSCREGVGDFGRNKQT